MCNNTGVLTNQKSNMNITLCITLTPDEKAKTIHIKNAPYRLADTDFNDPQIKDVNGIQGNYSSPSPFTEERINKMAKIFLSLYNEPFTKYHTWYSDGIKQHRLIFGK